MIKDLSLRNNTSTPEVGQMVGLTVKGMSLSGTLICNSEMGITVMDLFNDILTNISDIQNFLTQYNVTPLANKPGMIIQGFHMFYNCKSC